MIRIFLLIVLCTLSSFIQAEEDMQSLISDAKQHEAEQLREYTPFAMEAKQQESRVTAPYRQEAAMISATQSQHFIGESIKQKSPSVIIFVSFSMPEKSIQSYLYDAKKIHADVVIRGLINNSFKETFFKMASIVKQAGGGGVELNPPLFKKFNITNVPAVVVLSDSSSCKAEKMCSEKDFDIVYGDIPILDAIKLIRDHGEVSNKKADELLLLMKGAPHE